MPNENQRAIPETQLPPERQPRQGQASLRAPDEGERRAGRPLLFLDFDDVICVNQPYGGFNLLQPQADQPADLWERLWYPPSAAVLLGVMQDWKPRVVITSSWLRFMERAGFEVLFRRTGLTVVADLLHDAWEAPQDRGCTRLQAIERWLRVNHAGQPYVVLDDDLSGTGLRGSAMHKSGRVVLCEAGVGLHAGHLTAIRKALSSADTKD